jgi:flagella basal body P-ring formation protein FlgA
LKFDLIIFSALLLANAAQAEPGRSLHEHLSDLMKTALTEKIAGAEVRIPSLEKICSQRPLSDYSEVTRVRLVEDRPNGIALFEVSGRTASGTDQADLVQTPYSAWKRALVAKHRIYPNTKLKKEDFTVSEVNVATGSAREYRGVMVPAGTELSGLQSRLSILENQMVTTPAVEKSPDLKRGDLIKLDLVSGELTLSTQATAVESALIGDRVKVLTTKTKKEMVGTLREDHSVEVRL